MRRTELIRQFSGIMREMPNNEDKGILIHLFATVFFSKVYARRKLHVRVML
jgi:hypothetical protein